MFANVFFKALVCLTWNANKQCKTISDFNYAKKPGLSEYDKGTSRSKKAKIANKLKEYEGNIGVP